MAISTPMRDALRQVDRIFREGTHAGRPDGQLLDRFLAQGDDDAFAALVARHGPMVLRTALDLVHGPIDAEEVFQTTFLTLARRARTIRGSESVGAWLRRIARRTALRLNAREARRRRRDRIAVPVGSAPDPLGGPDREEIGRTIRAELDRLPEHQRRPVELCMMEGMTQPEAAACLGVSEGAIRGRLARARALLRDRLARRGLAPALPVLVGPAIPPAWVEAAVVAARAAVAGRGPAIGWMAAPAALRHAVALMVAGGVTLIAVALAADPPSPPPQLPAPPAIATGPAQAPAPARVSIVPDPVASLLRAMPGAKVAVRGRVLGPGGKPVAGARVYLIPDYRFDARLVATSDPDGSFRFEQPDEAFRPDPHAGIPPSWPALLVAKAEGFGTDWYAVGEPANTLAPSPMRREFDRDFHLPDDRPVEGRVVDPGGRPVAGARVDVKEIGVPPDLKWGPILDDLRGLKNVLSPIRTWSTVVNPWHVPFVPPAETDAEGRFRIAGLGRDRLVGLRVRGPGATPTEFSVVTRDDVDDLTRALRAKYPPRRPEGANPRAKAEPGVLLFGPSPAVEVDPARTFAGVVRADDTGEPLRDVGLSITSLNSVGGRNYGGGQATSGPDGRFRGLRQDGSPRIWVYAIPDRRGDYLPATRRFDGVEAPGKEVVADFRLARGVVVRGRATEAGSGRPIVSSPNDDCHYQGVLRAGFVYYYPLASNAALRDTPTGLYLGDPQGPRVETWAMIDGEGAFRILVPPGPGVLLAQSRPGMSMSRNLLPTPIWPEVDASRLILRLFPYAELRARIPGDGAPPTDDPSVLPGLAGPIPLASYHAYRVIDPPAGAREMTVDITLSRGAARLVRFVDPHGDPVPGPTVLGLLPMPQRPVILTVAEGEATALEPDRDRPLLAISADGRYFAKSSLRGDATTPVTIAMEPTGTVSGRLVDPEGRPLAHHAIAFTYDLPDLARPPGFAGASIPASTPSPPETDAGGRFRIAGLLPGFEARVWFQEKLPLGAIPTGRLAIYRPESLRKVAVRSGEVLDVGEVRATADR